MVARGEVSAPLPGSVGQLHAGNVAGTSMVPGPSLLPRTSIGHAEANPLPRFEALAARRAQPEVRRTKRHVEAAEKHPVFQGRDWYLS